MTKLILTTALALIGTAALADTKIVQGCEIVDKGGYSNLADPTCVFKGASTGGDNSDNLAALLAL